MELSLEELSAAGAALLPGYLGIEVKEAGEGRALAQMQVHEHHLAPNGYLHAAAVIALADTACGYGCILSLPEGGIGFTTIELKTNFLRTANEGTLACEAQLVHSGRTTQLWDATVTTLDGRPIALFRCTQLVLRETSA